MVFFISEGIMVIFTEAENARGGKVRWRKERRKLLISVLDKLDLRCQRLHGKK